MGSSKDKSIAEAQRPEATTRNPLINWKKTKAPKGFRAKAILYINAMKVQFGNTQQGICWKPE